MSLIRKDAQTFVSADSEEGKEIIKKQAEANEKARKEQAEAKAKAEAEAKAKALAEAHALLLDAAEDAGVSIQELLEDKPKAKTTRKTASKPKSE